MRKILRCDRIENGGESIRIEGDICRGDAMRRPDDIDTKRVCAKRIRSPGDELCESAVLTGQLTLLLTGDLTWCHEASYQLFGIDCMPFIVRPIVAVDEQHIRAQTFFGQM